MGRPTRYGPDMTTPLRSSLITLLVALATTCALLATPPVASADPAAGRCDPDGWVSAWAAASVGSGSARPDQTLREVVVPHAGGLAVRVELTNLFGNGPVTFVDPHVGLVAQADDLVPGTNTPLTFGGATTVTVPAGERALSDPAPLAITPFDLVAVSFHLPPGTGASTVHNGHSGLGQTSYHVAGNHAAADDLGQPSTHNDWVFVHRLDVLAEAPTPAVVALGDSITDGYLTTPDAQQRWPDHLTRRVLADDGVGPLSVVGVGISGNRVLNDSTGPSALSRFDRDVLAQPGVRAVIVFEGINDLGNQNKYFTGQAVTAEEIIAGYEELIQRGRDAGIAVIGATLTPAGDVFAPALQYGPFFSTPMSNADRNAINHWIRTSGAFDAVIDFDAALADPTAPEHLRAEYDTGDHLHPNDAGMAALADAVDLPALAEIAAC